MTQGVGPADWLFVGGGVCTMDPQGRRAEAVAVRAGRITAVGTDGELRRLAGTGTQVVELGGRSLLPGFQDSHIHAVGGGLARLRCDLSDATDVAGYVRLIERYAREHPDLPWITGDGWAIPAFPGGIPRRQLLDELVPDRPVFLVNRDHHGAWVNSRALERAGVTAATPDPPDGRIERDPDGSPTGTLQEGAMALVARQVPQATPAELREGLREAQRYLHAFGITGWQDAIVGAYDGLQDTFAVYRAAAETGELTARVVGALWWDRRLGPEQMDLFRQRRDGSGSGRFRCPTVKIMQDGICENLTAAVLEPYCGHADDSGGGRGLSFIDPERLPGYVTQLASEGFQVHFHAIGERGVREALDALEAARAAGAGQDLRHHIAHIQVVHPDDRPRFQQLGVAANMQPLWAASDPQMVEMTLPILGAERAGWQYPFASLHRLGTILCSGSDWPVSSPDPLLAAHVAVNRVPPPGGSRGDQDPVAPFLPEQRLDLETQLRAATLGSAYINHADGETGSIEVGKLADLAVLDRDVVQAPRSEIGLARVVLTLVGGDPVHADRTAVSW